jgi:hypothetical protein
VFRLWQWNGQLYDPEASRFVFVFITVHVKANSHIPCRAHAVPLPCRAARGLVYTGRPCLIDTCHAAPVPFPCHAASKATSQGHGTARYGRGRGTAWHVWINIGLLSTACGRPAYVRLLPANRRSLTKIVWWWCRQQISSSDFSGYHADFHEGDGRAGAQHGICELARPGPARARHGNGTACVN